MGCPPQAAPRNGAGSAFSENHRQQPLRDRLRAVCQYFGGVLSAGEGEQKLPYVFVQQLLPLGLGQAKLPR